MRLSKNQVKYIRSLEFKKQRKAEGLFLAEGPKLVGDLLGRMRCRLLVATDEWLAIHHAVPVEEVVSVSADELARASLLKAPQQVMALFEIPTYPTDASVVHRSLCLALDEVQDPGNLGTIVRLADWFGISHLFCSHGTADLYNPKAIQATMGSLARVQVHYVDLPELIRKAQVDVPGSLGAPVYGTFLDGENLYTHPLSAVGLLVMGNEGKGISGSVEQLIHHRLFIPSYPVGHETGESLNVAVATAVVCAEFRRRTCG